MIQMTREELDAVRLALAARARSNPAGSAEHQVCVGILDKIERAKDHGEEESQTEEAEGSFIQASRA